MAETVKCLRCPENKVSNFYKVTGGFYAPLGRLPICKDCFDRLYDRYVDKYNDSHMAIQRLCMLFDLYYKESIFDKCNSSKDFNLGVFFRNLNIVQYRGKCFDDTIDEGYVLGSTNANKAAHNTLTGYTITDVDLLDEEDVVEEVEQINPADIQKWGFGFTAEDYANMNNHYDMLKRNNPNVNSNQEIFIMNLCYTNMQRLKCLRNGEAANFRNLSDSYAKDFANAGLKTVRDASETEEFKLGVSAKTIEEYTPAEYYLSKKLYKDYDGIGEYYKRYVLRPLKNIMTGSTERDTEFFVPDGDDDGNGNTK